MNRFNRGLPTGIYQLIWWMPSLLGIILLPIGILFFEVIARIGFAEPRGEQLLFIFSILYGVGTGTITLLLVGKANLNENTTRKIKWLARFAIVTPIIFILVLFWIFSVP